MKEAAAVPDIVAAQAGDHAAFERLIEPYRRELLIHCYRMLGSFEDAEDTLQETFLRAWRRMASFEGRAPFRAWCYAIATHAALDARASLRRRSLPSFTYAPADPRDPLPQAVGEPLWIEPLPDAAFPAEVADPEAVFDSLESVSLAFLVALQRLPGRQRAVLILRDVLAWRAEEVAELLDVSVASVNSVLQRARATMRTLPDNFRMDASPPTADDGISALLSHYVQAWEAADVSRLVALLREDAVLTMPPLPAWYQGRDAIRAFLEQHLLVGDAAGRFRLLPTRANGCPAFAVYTRGADSIYRPGALQVLSIAGRQITAIHDFLVVDDQLFARFDLPPTV